ncbi:MAG: hypothetical protein NTX25_17820 [Proteobacteria bacterium]|nr:hypothetical protein [Pseudomonadota bacterium]
MGSLGSFSSNDEKTEFKQGVNPLIKAAGIILIALCTASLIPVSLKIMGYRTADKKTKPALALPLKNSKSYKISTKLRKIEPTRIEEEAANAGSPELVSQPVSKVAKTEVKAPAVQWSKAKLVPLAKKNQTKPKSSMALAAMELKPAPVEKIKESKTDKTADIKAAPKPAPVTTEKLVTARPKPPSAKVNQGENTLEEIPSSKREAQAAEKVLNSKTNTKTAGKNSNSLIRQVSLPPSGVAAINRKQPQAKALTIYTADPNSEGKTYSMTINNASFSKDNLNNCSKRCSLHVTDALGSPVRAIVDGTIYAALLLKHNGTINLSGQPKLIKNRQMLLVENISFNLGNSLAKAPDKPIKGHQAMIAPVAEDSGPYTEIPDDPDDLKPGTVIKSRKEIPQDISDGGALTHDPDDMP